MATITQVTPDQLATAVDLARVRCDKFNSVIASPFADLNVMVRIGKVQVVSSGDDMVQVQSAFQDLVDKIKYDRLRFAAGTYGSIWCDFECQDGDTWRAALNPATPAPPCGYQIHLSKITVDV